MVDDLTAQAWKDVIIDHNQFPRGHHKLENPSHTGQGENPFCGDRVSLQFKTDRDGVIQEAGFEATGCAISLSSASLLTASLKGRTIPEAEALFTTIHKLLTAAEADIDDDLGELAALALVHRYPARIKCASLAWHVLHGALQGEAEVVTTE
jgi:nitrogen fixation NifU-like protein